MSRGHCQPRNHPGRRTLERCKSKGTVANVEIIDVDKGKSDVVIIDVPESSHQESRCFRSKTRDCCPNVISIDDEEEGIDGAPSNARYAATSSAFCPLSSNSPFFEEFDGDECLMFVGKGAFQSKLTVEVKVHAKCGYPRSRYGPDPASNSGTSGSDNSEFYTSEGDSSEGNCSDCEIMEDASGEIREQWERAALRKKMLQRSQFVSEDQASASGSSADPGYQADEAIQNMVNIESINESDEAYSKHFEEVPGECGPSSSSNGKNSSSRMVNADEFTEDSLWGGKGNNSIANSDPSTGVSHYGPVFQNDELISEECSHRALPSDETCFNHKKDCFQDFEMEDSIQIRDEGFSFRDKDEQVPVETCYCTAEQVPVETCHCTAELRGETIFQDAESPCPGIPHKAWAGNTLFSDSVCFQEKKEPGLEEQPSCHNQSPLDSVVNHEIAAREKEDKEENSPEEQLCQTRSPCDSVHELAAQVKEKSHGEQTILFNYQPTNKQQNDVGNQSCQSKEGTSEELIFKPNEESGATESCPLYMESDLSHIQNDLIGAREKHKESDEYKRVEEEEWASRQQELQTQVLESAERHILEMCRVLGTDPTIEAEEAQRLRKKRKAENLRLIEMEKRQKQRLEEIWESQKKDKETMHLKEQFRAEIKKELDKMEMRYRDMASLLRGLGIRVEGGPFPLSCEVNAAYKQALLRFHPDRASRTDIRQQVEAEETFKLISRLKEKLLLA